MEELSKQLSTELNETITIHQVEGSWIKSEWGGDYNIYFVKCSNGGHGHRFLLTNINKNELLLRINGERINLYCNSKCDITTIIQMYNQTNEYKNSLDNEFNLDCAVTTFYDDDNVIDEVVIHISDYDLGKYIQPIYAKSYLECYQQINKIITLKNELLSQYGIIEESTYENNFVLNIKYNDIITIQYTIYHDYNNSNDHRKFRITIDTNKILIYEIYNQFRNYINSFIQKYDNDECFQELYCESSIYIDMSYDINSNIDIHKKIALELSTQSKEDIIIKKITNNSLKEEQEKFTTKLKLKYGEKTLVTNSYHRYHYPTSSIYLVISNVDTQHIDLLDIIHYYSGNRIVNGFIKQINCANYEKYINSNIDKPIFNITIQNCPNLKIINNIIDFENNAHLKICNCPKLEFIQNYNNFSEIYIENHKVKIFNE